MINSPRVENYANTPDMSATKLTETVIQKIKERTYDFIVINYANADMVGHTGDYKAACRAIEALDNHIFNLVKSAQENGYKIIITADHGNAEIMINDDSSPCKTHTCSKVPLIKLNCESNATAKTIAGIAHVVLEELAIQTPNEILSEEYS